MLRGPAAFVHNLQLSTVEFVRAGKLNDSDLDYKDRGAHCTTGPLRFFYLTELFGPGAVVTKPQGAGTPSFDQKVLHETEPPRLMAALPGRPQRSHLDLATSVIARSLPNRSRTPIR